ncbi:MAG: hypothetical protein L3J16_05900 [Anaerolineales bacterium]|nr:hypothetical protein [Anaerolineales bacterium]
MTFTLVALACENRADDVIIEKIILNGYNAHTVSEQMVFSIDNHSGAEQSIVEKVYVWQASNPGYKNGFAPNGFTKWKKSVVPPYPLSAGVVSGLNL